MIRAANLTKQYVVYEKEPGLAGSVGSLLHRRFRRVEAVTDLTFEVAPGEIVGFLGPNGAGKTTTLKMLSGLLHPTAGEVEVLGHLPQRRSQAFLRSISLVMGQKQQLNWDLTPADSFLVNRSIYEIPHADYTRRLAELTDLLGLGKLLNRQVRRLSLGERMKWSWPCRCFTSRACSFWTSQRLASMSTCKPPSGSFSRTTTGEREPPFS